MKSNQIARWLAGICMACVATVIPAAAPAPEQLLPADTLVVATIPDFQKTSSDLKSGAYGKLWNDPEMKPFRDNFTTRFSEEFITPLEKELGIKFEDYTVLAQGQLTFALVQNGWEGKEGQKPAWLAIVDSKDKSDTLKQQLAAVKQKWTESGKKLKTEKIRDLEFTTLVIENDELGKTFSKALKNARGQKTDEDAADKDKEKDKKSELIIGQSDSLLILGDDAKTIEKIISKQTGGLVPVIGESPAFESNYRALFRDSAGYVWVNAKPFVEIITRLLKEKTPASKPGEMLTPSPSKIISAIGVDGLNTLAFSFKQGPDGSLAQGFIGAPESTRKGLFKILVAENKEAAPPPFVPDDVIKFNRYRLNGKKLWAGLEEMVAEISPQLNALLQMSIGMLGKDKDPNFDFKQRFIANLGDDLIIFQRAPRGKSLEELDSPPTLSLLGSPDAEQFAQAIKAASALTPLGGEGVKEREFLGKKIYSLSLPPAPGPEGGKPQERAFSFAATGGYVAMSTDTAMLEEYLRGRQDTAKPLREISGLEEAARQVGGMNTGLFGFDNQTQTLRATLELAKTNPDVFEKFLLHSNESGDDDDDKADEKKPAVKGWFDYKLLPSFDKIAKYFHYSVFAGDSSADGLSFKWYSPTPPQLKQ